MYKKVLSALLALLLIYLAPLHVSAKSKAEQEAQRAEKVKQSIAKLGVGRDARIVVKLKDKRKLAGFISEAGEDSFVLSDLKTGMATTVAYPSVTQARGNNLSTGAKVAIGVGIGVAILLIILYAVNAGGVRFS